MNWYKIVSAQAEENKPAGFGPPTIYDMSETINSPKILDLRNPSQDDSVARENMYDVPEWKMGWLNEKINKLNKVCKKLNITPIQLEIIGESTKELEDKKVIVLKKVKITGEAPVLKGWKLIGRVMHTEEGNLMKLVPGEEVPTSYRTQPPQCDHCHANRRRNDTFIVKKVSDGEFKQVGSKCLKDFLGHMSPNAYASYAEALADLNMELRSIEDEDHESGMGGGRYGLPIEYFITMAYVYIKHNGYISRAKAKEQFEKSSTSDLLWGILTGKNETDHNSREQLSSMITSEDEKFAKSCIAWAKGLKDTVQPEALSDYLYNLSVASSMPIVTSATLGLMSSLPSAYQREVLSLTTSKMEGFLGKPGAKIVAKGTISDESLFSSATMYTLVTEDGAELKWFSNDIEYVEGSLIYISGVVKTNRVEFEKKITMLINVQVLDENGYNNLKESLKPKEEVAQGNMPNYADGSKIETEVTILDKKFVESMYGSSTLYKMVDAWGNNLTWFNGGKTGEEFDVGEKILIAGSVKKHDNYRGQEQIVLTRCKAKSRPMSEEIKGQILTNEQEQQLETEANAFHGEYIKNYGQGSEAAKKYYTNRQLITDLITNASQRIRRVAQEVTSGLTKNEKIYESTYEVAAHNVDEFLKQMAIQLKKEEEMHKVAPGMLLNEFNNFAGRFKQASDEINNFEKQSQEVEDRLKTMENRIKRSRELKTKFRVKSSFIVKLFKL